MEAEQKPGDEASLEFEEVVPLALPVKAIGELICLHVELHVDVSVSDHSSTLSTHNSALLPLI